MDDIDCYTISTSPLKDIFYRVADSSIRITFEAVRRFKVKGTASFTTKSKNIFIVSNLPSDIAHIANRPAKFNMSIYFHPKNHFFFLPLENDLQGVR